MDEKLARCVAFFLEMEARLAEKSVRTEHGAVHLSPSLPRVWYRNFLSVDIGAETTAAQLAAEAEAVQGPAGLRHRKVAVPDALGDRVAPAFRELGWKVEELLVMLHGGGEVAEPPNTLELDAETLAPVWAKGIAEHDPDEETVRQLVAAGLGRREAVDVRYFAVQTEEQVAAYCELFSRGGIGQIESVMTLREFRGRGFGKAVVARALAESKSAAHDLTFLLADAEDWPKELYRKLGFEEIGRVWDFTREPRGA
jgi:ribosomal protein S18 acetylase RimI-like enzyme